MWSGFIALIVGAACGVLLGLAVKKHVHDWEFSIIVFVCAADVSAAMILSLDHLLAATRLLLQHSPLYHLKMLLWAGTFAGFSIVAVFATIIVAVIIIFFDDDRWKRWLKNKTSAAKEELLAKFRELAPAPKPVPVPT